MLWRQLREEGRVSAEKNSEHEIGASEQQLVLAELEPGQLASFKKQRFPRRNLKGGEVFVLWTLRIYVVLMVAVVAYQIWTGAR
jgi:hypothetical protein